jgi:hypothetical protein
VALAPTHTDPVQFHPIGSTTLPQRYAIGEEIDVPAFVSVAFSIVMSWHGFTALHWKLARVRFDEVPTKSARVMSLSSNLDDVQFGDAPEKVVHCEMLKGAWRRDPWRLVKESADVSRWDSNRVSR